MSRVLDGPTACDRVDPDGTRLDRGSILRVGVRKNKKTYRSDSGMLRLVTRGEGTTMWQLGLRCLAAFVEGYMSLVNGRRGESSGRTVHILWTAIRSCSSPDVKNTSIGLVASTHRPDARHWKELVICGLNVAAHIDIKLRWHQACGVEHSHAGVRLVEITLQS